jgi:pyroglutamyl-peptidase
MKQEENVLLLGFEPFNGDDVNPSQQIVEALTGEIVAEHRIAGFTLPTEFARVAAMTSDLIAEHRASLVLAVGQAGGRDGISIERVAINVIDARVADNAGNRPIDVPVIDGAPNAYFSTLPIKAMLRALQNANISAAISNTAGTFVCNQVFYALAHLVATRHPHMRSGFVHVPFLPEQARRHGGAPSMELQTMIDATRICLDVALTTLDDLHFAAGATH